MLVEIDLETHFRIHFTQYGWWVMEDHLSLIASTSSSIAQSSQKPSIFLAIAAPNNSCISTLPWWFWMSCLASCGGVFCQRLKSYLSTDVAQRQGLNICTSTFLRYWRFENSRRGWTHFSFKLKRNGLSFMQMLMQRWVRLGRWFTTRRQVRAHFRSLLVLYLTYSKSFGSPYVAWWSWRYQRCCEVDSRTVSKKAMLRNVCLDIKITCL